MMKQEVKIVNNTTIALSAYERFLFYTLIKQKACHWKGSFLNVLV